MALDTSRRIVTGGGEDETSRAPNSNKKNSKGY